MPNNKLLIFHQGALGDLATFFPQLIRLRNRFGVIDIICKNQIGLLVRYLRLADTAYPIESAVFAALFSEGPIPEQLKMLSQYGTILLFSYSAELHHRVRSLSRASVHLIPPRPSPGLKIHIADYYAESLEKLSVLPQSTEHPETGTIFRDWRTPGFDPKRILIHPGSGSRRKNWPFENFFDLSRLLSLRNFETAFLCGPAEAHLNLNSDYPIERPFDLVGLTQTLMSAGAFIGNDSGVGHLASFLGLPTVAIFGPSDPYRWAPKGLVTTIARSAKDCPPCFETTDRPPCQSMHCLEDTSPATVMELFLKIYPG